MTGYREPSSSQTLNQLELSRLLDQAAANRRALEARGSLKALPLPGEIGLQLTNKCNLRCSHCFQWGDHGQYNAYPRDQQNADLATDLIDHVLQETRSSRARLYVWGGEPLAYRHFSRLLEMIQREDRWCVVCTNGVGMSRHLNAIREASSRLVMLFSLDGLEAQNDALRGKGSFKKTVSSIERLVEEKRAGTFKGEVSIAAVLSDDLAGSLSDFCRSVEGMGVNTLHLNFPWFISEDSARRMDAYYERGFAWLKQLGLHSQPGLPSWHSYGFRIAPEKKQLLVDEIRRLYGRKWNMRIKIQPAMSEAEMNGFMEGRETPLAGYTECASIFSRLSILPNGRVTTCKLFPEFTIGDLNRDSLTSIWHGEIATRVRTALAESLSPVCTRCVQLYLNRPKVGVAT